MGPFICYKCAKEVKDYDALDENGCCSDCSGGKKKKKHLTKRGLMILAIAKAFFGKPAHFRDVYPKSHKFKWVSGNHRAMAKTLQSRMKDKGFKDVVVKASGFGIDSYDAVSVYIPNKYYR